MKQRKTNHDEVVRCLIKSICIKDIYETTTEMENKYHLEISCVLNKELLVVVEKDKKEKMMEQFQILNYEQISPN